MQIVFLQGAGMTRDETKGDRLKQARAKRYATAKEAAVAIGAPYGTYSGHEAGSRGFDNDEAARYAAFFRVSVSWLVFGEVNRPTPTIVPLIGRIAAGGSIETGSEQVDPTSQPYAELKAHIPRATTAYEIIGSSMLPYFRPGSIIVCGPETDKYEEYYGEEVACCDGEGNRYLKILHPGTQDQRYNLLSHNATLMINVFVQWVAPIVAIIPEKQWKRLDKANEIRKFVRAAE